MWTQRPEDSQGTGREEADSMCPTVETPAEGSREDPAEI